MDPFLFRAVLGCLLILKRRCKDLRYVRSEGREDRSFSRRWFVSLFERCGDHGPFGFYQGRALACHFREDLPLPLPDGQKVRSGSLLRLPLDRRRYRSDLFRPAELLHPGTRFPLRVRCDAFEKTYAAVYVHAVLAPVIWPQCTTLAPDPWRFLLIRSVGRLPASVAVSACFAASRAWMFLKKQKGSFSEEIVKNSEESFLRAEAHFHPLRKKNVRFFLNGRTSMSGSAKRESFRHEIRNSFDFLPM